MGLLCISSSTVLLLFLSPDIGTPCPSWFYVYSAVMIYLYQVFDNIDGRQARRTGTSSPLGELFDHGCDALYVTCGQLLLANVFGFRGVWVILMLLFCVVPFYFSHLEEYALFSFFIRFYSFHMMRHFFLDWNYRLKFVCDVKWLLMIYFPRIRFPSPLFLLVYFDSDF